MSAILRPGNESTTFVEQEGFAWQSDHGRALHNAYGMRLDDYVQQEGFAWQTGHGRTLHNMAWE